MRAIDSIKKELLIGKLPETGRPEVLQSVNDLRSSQNQSVYQSPVDEYPDRSVADRDPLSEFIGAVENGYLAENMDAEIYETSTFGRWGWLNIHDSIIAETGLMATNRRSPGGTRAICTN